MIAHDCYYNCGRTDCDAPNRPKKPASSGSSDLLLRVLASTPTEPGAYWFRDVLNNGPWLICRLRQGTFRFGEKLVFEHEEDFIPLEEVQEYRHYDFAGPIPEPKEVE